MVLDTQTETLHMLTAAANHEDDTRVCQFGASFLQLRFKNSPLEVFLILKSTGIQVVNLKSPQNLSKAATQLVHVYAQIRPHSKVELNSTLVLALQLVEVSAKVRTGHVKDDEKDYRRDDIWAGILPFAPLAALEPIDDPRLLPGIPPAKSVTNYKRHKG